MRAVGRAGIVLGSATALAFAVVLAAARVGERAGVLSNWQALVLGLVQGLTELLPISSSGHLILVPWLANWEYLKAHDEFNQTFDVALHLGTLFAVVAYFRRDVGQLIAAWVETLRRRRIESPAERVAWFVALATIPAATVGALGENFITGTLGEPWQIAILLAVFAVILWLADRKPPRKEMAELGFGAAVAVGLAQSLALAPGVSRSGITITAGRFLGLDRDAAARFSFLLLIPTTFGAIVWKGVTDVLLGDLPAGWVGPFVVGMIAASVSALVATWALLGFVRRHDYSIFAVYRLLAAAAVLLLIATGVRQAGF